MDKIISELIGENTVLKNEVAERKKFLQFDTDQWEENFKTFDNLKRELLQNQKHQQQEKQPVTTDLKEIKDKLKDLENRSRRNNLRIDEIIEEENESWSKVRKNFRKSLKINYSSNGTLKLNVHTLAEKQC